MNFLINEKGNMKPEVMDYDRNSFNECRGTSGTSTVSEEIKCLIITLACNTLY